MNSDQTATARMHSLLRFSTGVTVAFVLSEAMGWAPTFLPPVLLAVLLSNLPFAPPLKVGVLLIAVMAVAALVTFLLSGLLMGAPQVLVVAIGLIVFLALVTMAQGRAKLPATLLLICISTIPIIAMIAPAYADILPIAMVRGIAVAMLVIWCMYALWPQVAPPNAPPTAPIIDTPVKVAIVGTAVVMPLMLVYLLFGLADALPVLVTTVMLVTTFDPQQGAKQGLAMVLGNLLGGVIAAVAFLLLGIAPSLFMLALLTFLIALAFAVLIEKGGAGGAVALLTCNSTFIILSSAIASPATSSGVWLTRLFQFVLACAFAIGMMTLVWGKTGSLEAKTGETL